MPDRKATATAGSPFMLLTGRECLKALSEGPAKLCGELFDFTATRLRAQADFIQGLADYADPTDLVRRHVEFIQSSWKTYSEEASGIYGSAPGILFVSQPGSPPHPFDLGVA